MTWVFTADDLDGHQVGYQAVWLLILICPPLRKAEWRFCAVVPRQGCRVSRARPGMADRGGPTEQDRSEGTPNLSEGPDAWGKTFWFLLSGPAFRAFVKSDSP